MPSTTHRLSYLLLPKYGEASVESRKLSDKWKSDIAVSGASRQALEGPGTSAASNDGNQLDDVHMAE